MDEVLYKIFTVPIQQLSKIFIHACDGMDVNIIFRPTDPANRCLNARKTNRLIYGSALLFHSPEARARIKIQS
jgi:hypothetical protein